MSRRNTFEVYLRLMVGSVLLVPGLIELFQYESGWSLPGVGFAIYVADKTSSSLLGFLVGSMALLLAYGKVIGSIGLINGFKPHVTEITVAGTVVGTILLRAMTHPSHLVTPTLALTGLLVGVWLWYARNERAEPLDAGGSRSK